MNESAEPSAPDEGPAAAEVPEPSATPPPSEPAPETETAPSPEPEPAAPPPPKRLQRSRNDRVIAGVCGGLGEYLGVDAVLIRIAALLLLFAGGAGFILYVIGWIAMPEAPEGGEPAAAPSVPADRTTGKVVLGLVFVVIGLFFLFDQALPDLFEWEWIWPVALIAVGALVILRARR
jgi:phage shock protein C